MDHPDKSTSDFERRASRRTSRQVSNHAAVESEDNDDNAASTSEGSRSSTEPATVSAAPATARSSPDAPRRTLVTLVNLPDEHPSAATGTVHDASSISIAADTDSFPATSDTYSGPSSPVQPTASPTQQHQQTSSVPTEVLEIPEEAPSGSALSSQTSLPPPVAESSTTGPRARPSSIAKPPIGPLSHASSSRAGSSQRGTNVRASTASSVAMPQQDEPYQGPSGPSFPYQMYPQNVGVTRPLSGATASTASQAESSYNGPRGPAFPYAMYPQATPAVPTAAAVAGPGTGIPVGFPGMADNYQRRLGPEGEEIADLIGPDGHTEQLPPYTRYPDEAYNRKIAAATGGQAAGPLGTCSAVMAAAAVPEAGMFSNSVPVAIEEVPGDHAASDSAQAAGAAGAAAAAVPRPASPAPPACGPTAQAASPTVATITGAGGIGLAPHNPEFDGAESAASPQSRLSLRSFNSDNTGPEINTAARGTSEKRRPPTALQRYGSRRAFGVIPYWAICLVVTALIMMGIILGAVLGTFVSRHKKVPPYDKSKSITVTVDATPIATPTNLPALPTGTYGIPLQKEEGPTACFNDSSQEQAWTCNIPYQYAMTVSIEDLAPESDGPRYNICINGNASATVENNAFFYGVQAPVIPSPVPMFLVNDTLDPSRGPAWFRMMPYNKTVVVHESLLSTSSSSDKKRDNAGGVDTGSIVWGDGQDGNPYKRKSLIPAQAGDRPWVCTWPDTILEVFIYPNQNTSLYKIGVFSDKSASTTATLDVSAPAGAYMVAATATATSTETTSTLTASTASTVPTNYGGPPPFPRVFKLEERRMANSPQPTCVQYELTKGAYGVYAKPRKDLDGNPIQILISEVETGPSLFSNRKREVFGNEFYERDGEMLDERDSSGLSKCACLWMMT